MTLADRDRTIVQLVARFHQLTSSHIHELVFAELTTRTPCDRALKRLVAAGYLARIERRLVGGAKGGSGQYCYQLGRRGFYLHFQGRYQPARAVNYHTLAIADVYLALRKLEREGSLVIVGMSEEPHCHVTLGSIELKPDLYIEIARRGATSRRRLFVEVDMGTEGQRQIKDKYKRYWRAYQDSDRWPPHWPDFPKVWFVAVDQERANELTWLLTQGPNEAQPLFTVTTLAELVDKLR